MFRTTALLAGGTPTPSNNTTTGGTRIQFLCGALKARAVDRPASLSQRTSARIRRPNRTAVGIAAGFGREASAVLGTVLAVLVLTFLPSAVQRQGRDREREGANGGESDKA